jgi:hypothetical protein
MRGDRDRAGVAGEHLDVARHRREHLRGGPRVRDRDHLRVKRPDLLDEPRHVLPGGQADHAEPLGEPTGDVERLDTDRAGRA